MNEYEILDAELRRMAHGNMCTTINAVGYHAGQEVRTGRLTQAEVDELLSTAQSLAINAQEAEAIFCKAYQQGQGAPITEGVYRRKRTPEPQAVDVMNIYIKAGRGYRTPEDLASLSPVPIPSTPEEQRGLFLRRLFQGENGARRTIGATKKDGAQFTYNALTLEEILSLSAPPELVSLNAVAPNEKGVYHRKKEYMVNRYMLIESDDLPIEAQCAFFAGMIIKGYKYRIVAIVFSGSKSLHGVIELYQPQPLEAYKYLSNLIRRTLPKIDEATLNNNCVGVRLAGATRADTGKSQKLLFLTS